MASSGREVGPFSSRGLMTHILSLDGKSFVRSAYLTILGRDPDFEGEQTQLKKMQSGISKWTILYELRFSDEGRKFDPGIAGLDRMLKHQRRLGLPLIGFVFRQLAKSPYLGAVSTGLGKRSSMVAMKADARRQDNLEQPWAPRASEIFEMLQNKISKVTEAG